MYIYIYIFFFTNLCLFKLRFFFRKWLITYRMTLLRNCYRHLVDMNVLFKKGKKDKIMAFPNVEYFRGLAN